MVYCYNDTANGGYHHYLVDEPGSDAPACRGVRTDTAFDGAGGKHADKGIHAPRVSRFPRFSDSLFQLDRGNAFLAVCAIAGLVKDTPQTPHMEGSFSRHGVGNDPGYRILVVKLILNDLFLLHTTDSTVSCWTIAATTWKCSGKYRTETFL